MHVLAALAAASLLAAPCQPEGLYKAEQGFFTRYFEDGRWETLASREAAPALKGRYSLSGSAITFTAAGVQGEFPYIATVSSDCADITLRWRATETIAYVFHRVTANPPSKGGTAR